MYEPPVRGLVIVVGCLRIHRDYHCDSVCKGFLNHVLRRAVWSATNAALTTVLVRAVSEQAWRVYLSSGVIE